VDEYCEVDSIRALSSHVDGSEHLTMIFNACVLMALANTLNCRKVHNEANRCQGIFKHKMLVVLVVATFCVHLVLVQSFGSVMSGAKDGLSGKAWVICLILGLSVLAWGQLLRLIPSRFCARFARRFNEAAAVHELDEEQKLEKRKRRHHFCRCHVKGGARLRKDFSQVRLSHPLGPARPLLRLIRVLRACGFTGPHVQVWQNRTCAGAHAVGCARAHCRHGLGQCCPHGTEWGLVMNYSIFVWPRTAPQLSRRTLAERSRQFGNLALKSVSRAVRSLLHRPRDARSANLRHIEPIVAQAS
jgi:hypothetical protein